MYVLIIEVDNTQLINQLQPCTSADRQQHYMVADVIAMSTTYGMEFYIESKTSLACVSNKYLYYESPRS